MARKQVKLSITLGLDKDWAMGQREAEFLEYVENRLNTTLGFRGHVANITISRKPKS